MGPLKRLGLTLVLILAACGGGPGQAPIATAASSAGWVARSNANAKLLVDLDAKYVPEQASSLGAEGFDDQIIDYTPGHDARLRAETQRVKSELEARLANEKDREVALDLKVLVASADRATAASLKKS